MLQACVHASAAWLPLALLTWVMCDDRTCHVPPPPTAAAAAAVAVTPTQMTLDNVVELLLNYGVPQLPFLPRPDPQPSPGLRLSLHHTYEVTPPNTVKIVFESTSAKAIGPDFLQVREWMGGGGRAAAAAAVVLSCCCCCRAVVLCAGGHWGLRCGRGEIRRANCYVGGWQAARCPQSVVCNGSAVMLARTHPDACGRRCTANHTTTRSCGTGNSACRLLMVRHPLL